MPHIHDKIDFCSEVYIVFDNKVLLRKHDKLKFWLSVGGHIELDEDLAEAAIREVKEEVGLDIELLHDESRKFNSDSFISLPVPAFVNRHPITETHEHVAFVFFAKSKTDKLNLSETEITEECRWFSLKDLDEDKEIKEQIKFYATEALKRFS